MNHHAVRRYISLRRAREDCFGADLFADAAWDILLDLFVAHGEYRRISVSSACIAAAVPPTTALRTLSTLLDRGLIVREPDHHDYRRKYVRLTDAALDGLTRFARRADAIAHRANAIAIEPQELTKEEAQELTKKEAAAERMRDILAQIRTLVA